MISKEQQWMLDAVRRKVGREHGFRQNSYINFKEKEGYFFCLYFSLEDARLEVKPIYADDLWWEIWEVEGNKREPLSFRGKGEFALSGQVLTTIAVFVDSCDFYNIDIRQFYERVFNEADVEIERFLSLNPDVDSFVPDESKIYHDPDRLLYLMALIHSGDNQKVLSIIKEARQNKHKCELRTGLFDDSYTYIRRWCKRDGFFNNIDRHSHKLINLIVKTVNFATMSMSPIYSRRTGSPDPMDYQFFGGSVSLSLFIISLAISRSPTVGFISCGIGILLSLLIGYIGGRKCEIKYRKEYLNLPIKKQYRLTVISWATIFMFYFCGFATMFYVAITS